MPLEFQPKTEEELKTFVLLPEGEYDFDVIGAEEQTSKSGNAMIKLTLKVYGYNGEITTVYDYLLASLEYKIKHFCDTAGLVAEYEAGTLSADMCSNRSGKCKLKIDKDKNGVYEDKNAVKDYTGKAVDASDVPF